MVMSASQSVLVVVDVQEKLIPAIPVADRVIANTGRLIEGARRLEIPILATEQYPKGLGPTVGPLAERLAPGETIDKLHFSCTEDPTFRDRLAALGRRQVVLAGIEAHVCMLQTALGLGPAGYSGYVVADATGSREAEDTELALARLRSRGIDIVSTEMVLFEWMYRAGTPAFKDISRMIR